MVDLSRQQPLGYLVLHVGPNVERTGGMETVIRAYRDGEWKHIRTSVAASSGTRGLFTRVALLLGAAGAIRKSELSTIVHLHLSHRGSFIREGILARVAGRRRTVVATIHGSSFVSSSKTWIWHSVYRWALRPVMAVATLNAESLACAEGLASVPCSILPNPGPVNAGQIDRQNPRLPKVVFAGAVGERKGVDTLLEAWDLVLASIPTASLIILGPVEPTFLRQWGERLSPYYGGEANSTTVQGHLQAATCAVLPSRAEGQPMFLIEALGLGTPIVVTPIGGMPGLAEGCGLVVSRDDPADLARAIIVLLSNKETFVKFSVAAAMKYAKDFSVESHEKRLISLYDQASRR